ncbi:UNVERIFIED_ORG: methyl-accepting chemotaxis protein [Methylobacterium sp. SuP10 SLI 274]|nr:methyl-accepting chemotaxis protein [Methylorubrum extorquens]MDF9791058.1 methyl-accepting chemotaxis protein [Methylorubrum extorquens]MDF9862762.1 methyl-accepting chemotaxis protein [Methylorubrum pseudosasae]MDH6636373.1 methyl-accepting chemotaxis protein [Methylobacterium sp. SuP10 SLI 274]MDH6665551.1 methyl-accepting chemotaxis protein [Methylorubrum zatmanii]
METGIRTRLYGGFSALVALSCGMGAFSYTQLDSLDEMFRARAQLESAARTLYTINGLSDRLIGQAAQYRLTQAPDYTTGMFASLDSIRQGSEKLIESTPSAERRAAYERLRDQSTDLGKALPKLVELGAQIRENRAGVYANGDDLTKASGVLVAQLRATGQDAVIAQAVEVERTLLLFRIMNWRFLATKDPKGRALSANAFGKAEAALAKLKALDLTAADQETAKLVGETLNRLNKSIVAASQAIVESEAFFEETLKPRVDGINATGLSVRSKLEAALQDGVEQSNALMTRAKTVQLILLGLILATGAALAFLIARSLIRPISGMTAAMSRLAAGETAIEVPSRDAVDEMGRMAEAVEVFRQNAVARIELEAERVAQQSARQRRADRVDGLVRGFEEKIAASIAIVTSAATELDSTARSMTQVADNTNGQAVASSAAAEEATVNVQTVAAAAEEMVASLSEIERRVQQSNDVAGHASHEARTTTDSMSHLSRAAEKIGEAVTMISGLASQTNLLALNATIEASRAGEAGRGFAVVATEVKELAAQTARTTEAISDQVSAIQTASTQALGAIQQIGRTIVSVNDITASIAATVVQQTAATNEIARNASEAARGTQDVSMSVAQVQALSSETGSAAQQVMMASSELSTQSENVRREVEDFLAAIRAA